MYDADFDQWLNPSGFEGPDPEATSMLLDNLVRRAEECPVPILADLGGGYIPVTVLPTSTYLDSHVAILVPRGAIGGVHL